MRTLPDRLIIVRWKIRGGYARAYYYNNQSGYIKDLERSKIKLSADRREAMRMYAEIEGREPVRDTQTVEAAWELFESHPRGLAMRAPKTAKFYRECWVMVGRVFGAVMWDEIERVHAIEYLDNRKNARTGKHAPRMANGEIKLLSLLWSFALNRGLTKTANVLDGIEYNRIKPRARYVSDAEYNRVLLAAPTPLNRFLRLMYLTGQRPQDTLNLTWDHVRTERIIVDKKPAQKTFVTCWQSKVSKEVDVEALPGLLALLNEIRASKVNGIRLITTASGQRVTLRSMQDQLRAVLQAAGLSDIRLQDMRPKSASDEQEGATARLGHSSEAFTKQTYRRSATKARSTK